MTSASPSTIKGTLHLPRLYPKQKAAIFCDARYSIIEASTKSGKTVSCLTWLLSRAWLQGKEGRAYWWVAPTLPVAKIAYRRLKRMLARSDPHQTLWNYQQTETRVTLINGASIWFKGSDDPDSLYGEDVFDAVVDEASRCKPDAWHALRSTLTATRGSVRVIGNVKGRKNWAYELARKAQSGEQGMAYHKLTAWDAVEGGVLKREEIEDAQRLLPDPVFRELYLAEPSDDGGNPFGLPAIRAAAASWKPGGEPKFWGVDLAKSMDWSVIVGLDKDGNETHFERWQSDWGATRRRILATLNGRGAVIDSTGVGDPIVEDLQSQNRRVQAFRFTSQSKQQLMEGLASAIHQGKIKPHSEQLINELEVFEYEYSKSGVRYNAPAGLHDDCVCALALAVHHMGNASPSEVPFRLIGSKPNAGDGWRVA